MLGLPFLAASTYKVTSTNYLGPLTSWLSQQATEDAAPLIAYGIFNDTLLKMAEADQGMRQ